MFPTPRNAKRSLREGSEAPIPTNELNGPAIRARPLPPPATDSQALVACAGRVTPNPAPFSTSSSGPRQSASPSFDRDRADTVSRHACRPRPNKLKVAPGTAPSFSGARLRRTPGQYVACASNRMLSKSTPTRSWLPKAGLGNVPQSACIPAPKYAGQCRRLLPAPTAAASGADSRSNGGRAGGDDERAGDARLDGAASERAAMPSGSIIQASTTTAAAATERHDESRKALSPYAPPSRVVSTSSSTPSPRTLTVATASIGRSPRATSRPTYRRMLAVTSLSLGQSLPAGALQESCTSSLAARADDEAAAQASAVAAAANVARFTLRALTFRARATARLRHRRTVARHPSAHALRCRAISQAQPRPMRRSSAARSPCKLERSVPHAQGSHEHIAERQRPLSSSLRHRHLLLAVWLRFRCREPWPRRGRLAGGRRRGRSGGWHGDGGRRSDASTNRWSRWRRSRRSRRDGRGRRRIAEERGGRRGRRSL